MGEIEMIGLHSADDTEYPNLALMKLSAAMKRKGKITELWNGSHIYEVTYSSKVFSFSKEPTRGILSTEDWVLGGFGRNLLKNLPDSIEHICPDYKLYGLQYSMGFLTRGCPNKCPWCVVPEKEGDIRAHANFSEFVRHKEVVFMDNNVLASDHGISQIEKLAQTKIAVDFNQGLDARRIDNHIAKKLARLKWKKPLRLACDSHSSIEPVRKAIENLRWNNVRPRNFFCYVLATSVEETLERIRFLKSMDVDPFVQPFIPKEGTKPSRELRRLARWVNLKQLFNSVSWEEYQKQQGSNI